MPKVGHNDDLADAVERHDHLRTEKRQHKNVVLVLQERPPHFVISRHSMHIISYYGNIGVKYIQICGQTNISVSVLTISNLAYLITANI